MALLDLLLADDVAGFNAARGRRAALALASADLSGRTLPGVDLAHADLENADLSRAVLKGAVLVQARLDGADLTEADLREVMGHRSRWRGAFLGQARLAGAELPRADFSEAELPGADAEGADLSGARLRGADLSGARLAGADLREAQLNGARLAGALLPRAVLTQAQLVKADLSGADLSEADLGEARLSQVEAPGAHFGGARLVGADLTEANLEGADLRGADLTRADLGGARLQGAKLEGALVREARLDGASLSGAGLAGAVLDDASLGAPPDEDPTPPEALQFEDLVGCATEQGLGLLWENREGPGRARLRVVAVGRDGAWDGRCPALPEPADLVVARGLLPASVGFQALLFVQRPGGLVCRVTEISPQGDVGATRSLACDVVPAVRPVFFPGTNGHLLALIGRRGPSVHVFALGAEGLQPLARQPVPTARGFVEGLQPAVLCKGGVVFPLDERGLGAAASVPASFPGRQAAAARCGGALFVAWSPQVGTGLEWAVLGAGRGAGAGRLARRAVVGSLDCVAWGDQVLLLWTEEGLEPGDASRLCGALLPGGQPFELLAGELAEPDQVRVLTVGEDAAVSVLDGAGGVCLLDVRPGRARLVRRLP